LSSLEKPIVAVAVADVAVDVSVVVAAISVATVTEAVALRGHVVIIVGLVVVPDERGYFATSVEEIAAIVPAVDASVGDWVDAPFVVETVSVDLEATEMNSCLLQGQLIADTGAEGTLLVAANFDLGPGYKKLHHCFEERIGTVVVSVIAAAATGSVGVVLVAAAGLAVVVVAVKVVVAAAGAVIAVDDELGSKEPVIVAASADVAVVVAVAAAVESRPCVAESIG
jgi:hypothetical protein